MDFYESITHALYCRMEAPGAALTGPLEQMEEYRKQENTLKSALTEIGAL